MSNLLNRKSVTQVSNYLKNIDKNYNLIVLDETARTAKDAAKSLNKEVGAIVKSLLFKDSKKNEYYLCLVSGDQYISEDKLSKKIGEDIKKADAEECKKITGFSIGGVAPVAHLNKPKIVLIDKNLNRFEMLYAAAGHPYVVFGITYNNLCSITGGKIEDIVL